jgi:hypothetical protein
MKASPSTATFSRRAWIRGGGAGLAVLLAQPRLVAQDTKVGDVLESMSSLTGTRLEDRWVEPTAALVSAILEDSKSLRSLDLGEIEPAITFSAR